MEERYVSLAIAILTDIRKNHLKTPLIEWKSIFKCFKGSAINRIKHFVQPILVEDKPDALIVHVDCNNFMKPTKTSKNSTYNLR